MEKIKSQKLLPWKKNDYILNLIVYCANIIVFMLFYIGVRILDGKNITEVFANVKEFVSFMVLLTGTFSVLALYLAFEDRNFLKNPANSELLFLIMELSFIVCFASGKYVNIYLRPIALVALLTLFLAGTRKAMFTNTIFCIVIFLFDAYANEGLGQAGFMVSETFFLVIGIVSSAIAIYVSKNVYSRIKILLVSLCISIPAVICISIPLVNFGNGDYFYILYGLASGPLSAACCMIILPILESIFNRVTCFKYAELTDHKSKLIKRMIEQAPGTFNHSMVVSNIAEACASAIGEDPLLARTCAYYHDVGKLRRPEMFKENQVDGINLHSDLTPELSANIIRAHTQDGYALMKKNRLPHIIAEVCLQHHGTMPMLFFYDKARKFTDGEVDIQQYCYSGPKPKSKIAAIIMIADASEAVTRVLTDRSRENVLATVRGLVNERMTLGQFEECEITLNELNIVVNTVVNSLTGVYHNRVEYPKVDLDGVKLNKDATDE